MFFFFLFLFSSFGSFCTKGRINLSNIDRGLSREQSCEIRLKSIQELKRTCYLKVLLFLALARFCAVKQNGKWLRPTQKKKQSFD